MRPITASDLMNPEVLTVQTGMTVRELASFLIDNEISGAPVADSEGRLVGVVSLRDLMRVASIQPVVAPGTIEAPPGPTSNRPGSTGIRSSHRPPSCSIAATCSRSGRAAASSGRCRSRGWSG